MTDHIAKLNEFLNAGYRADVLGEGSADAALSLLNREMSSDAEFGAFVRSEADRLNGLVRTLDSRRCFVTTSAADFLKRAVERADVQSA